MTSKPNPFAPSNDIATTRPTNHLLFALTATLCLAGVEPAMAQRTWTGGGADTNWSTAANWSTNTPASGNLGVTTFAGDTRNTSTNNVSNIIIGGWFFTNNGAMGKTKGFDLSGSAVTVGANNMVTTAIISGAASINNTLRFNLVFSGDRIFNMSANHDVTITGNISEVGGSRLLTKNGLGTLTLSGNNTYTGLTAITGGTLSISGVADGASASNIGTGNLRIGDTVNAGTLNYTGPGSTTIRTVQIGNGTASHHTGGAIISANGNDGGSGLKFTAAAFNPADSAATAPSRTLTLTGSNTDANTISGVIANVNGTSKTNITKSGAGQWTLGGANTYTGNTTVSSGTLRLGRNDALPDGSAVSIGAGTLDVSSFVDDAGALDVTNTAATLNIGSGGTMAFANSSEINWAGGKLNITGNVISGSSIRFGTDSTGLTSTQLGLISVNNSQTICTLDSNGFLVYDTTPAYLRWSGGTAFNIDLNGDDIESGVAWLLGASDPNVDAGELVDTSLINSDKLMFNLISPSSLRDGAVLYLNYRFDPGSAWIEVPVPDTTGSAGAVGFVVIGSLDPKLLHVTATITRPGSAGTGALEYKLTSMPPVSMPSSTEHLQQGTDQLVVYGDVPGLVPSEHYRIRVRSAATNGQWQYVFAHITRNYWNNATVPKDTTKYTANPAGYNGHMENYFYHTRDWSHTYGNIEMSSSVDIEISKADGTPIETAAAHPTHKAQNVRVNGGKAYLTLPNPVAITVDIDNKMDGQHTGTGYLGGPIHTVGLFANPIMGKPVLGMPGVVEVVAGSTPPTDSSTYQTLYFSGGVHDIGRSFPLASNRSYYISGDAVIYGTFTKWDTSPSADIKIFGVGTISGDRIIHPRYDPAYSGITGYNTAPNVEALARAWKPIAIRNCVQNIQIEGVCLANPATHSLNLWYNPGTYPQSSANWVKVISWRGNGDGISPHLTQDCFMRTADDCSYMRGDKRRCIFWTDVNGAVVHMGDATTRPTIMEDCDVIYLRSVVMDSAPGGKVIDQRGEGSKGQKKLDLIVRDIRFTDRFPTHAFFRLYSVNPNQPSGVLPIIGSSYSGIRFENITVTANSFFEQHKNILHGHAEAPWSNLTFKNVVIAGKKMTSLADFNDVNEHVTDIVFE